MIQITHANAQNLTGQEAMALQFALVNAIGRHRFRGIRDFTFDSSDYSELAPGFTGRVSYFWNAPHHIWEVLITQGDKRYELTAVAD